MSNTTPLLNYKQAGQGPAMLILHGLLGSLDNFRSVGLHLERHFQVTRMDLPAHGKSPTLDELSLQSMSEAVIETIDTMGINQLHLMGHSLGGKVALQIAAALDPNRLKSLILVDIAPREYPKYQAPILDALNAINLADITSRRDAETQLRTSIEDAGMRAFLLKGLYKDEHSQWAWYFDIAKLRHDYPLLSRAPTIGEPITAPSLFIKGGDSDYLTEEDEPEIRRICRNPSLKEIKGTGHWPHAEKPAVFTDIVLNFAKENQ